MTLQIDSLSILTSFPIKTCNSSTHSFAFSSDAESRTKYTQSPASLAPLAASLAALEIALAMVRTLSQVPTFPSEFLLTSRIGLIFNMPASLAAIGVKRPPRAK